MKNNNEEIDLKQILLLIIKFFTNHKSIWIIFIIIGIAVGIYKYSTTKIYYEAEMIVTSGLLYETGNGIYETDLQIILSILSSLEEQINAKNYKYVKNALNTDEINYLNKFSASVYIDKALTKSEPKNIKIKVEVYDINKLIEFQEMIVSFCNNNEFIEESFNNQKRFRENSIEIINNKLKVIDTLENLMNNNNLQKNKVFFLNFTEWSDFANLEINKLKYESLYNAEQPLTVVQNLNTFPRQINEKLKQGIIFFILVIILGIGVAFFIDVLKFLKNE